MSTQLNRFKILMMASLMGAGLLAARTASACTNDIECPNAACGGQVCDWTKGMTCSPAGGAAKGADGWCMSDSDCKCFGLGARCAGVQCTFTLPSQAPGAVATGGASGSTGGVSGGTGGATASTGGSSGSTGGATGTDGGTPAKDDGGGCSVAGAASYSWLGAMGALAALLATRRRRDRA